MNILGSIKSLTKFEWALWICSVLTVVTAFVFSGDVLNLVASLIGVTALIFVAKGLVLGQVLTVVFSAFYGIISFELRYYGEVISQLDEFLPYVDNWATCDMMKPKIFKNHLPKLKEKCFAWIESEHTYTVRFGIVMLMTHFLDDEFDISIPERISQIRNEGYYVKMAVAWYFATALSKKHNEILSFIKNNKLDPWTHNKAIQKARESHRITPEQKKHLAMFKINL